MGVPPVQGGSLLVVAGPTASGKSALSLRLARSLNGTIINADSIQLYADLEILTARPSRRVMAGVPHELYGILAARDVCSAGRWQERAWRVVQAVWDGGRLPILTGGSGLYLRSFFGGLAAIPAVSEAIRSHTMALYHRLGPREFHRQLSLRDPDSAARIHLNDRQRMMRAWEVMAATGRPLSQWQQDSGYSGLESKRGQRLAVIFEPEKSVLDSAIADRFHKMMDAGALEEVSSLLECGLSPALPIMKALGVRPLSAYLQQKLSLDEAVTDAIRATQRYAKRQRTWFKHQSLGPDVTVKRFLVPCSRENQTSIHSEILEVLGDS